MSDRLTLALDPVRHGSRCPVHPSHRLALVGEAPGPNTHTDMPLYPAPERSAAGRLRTMLGWSRSEYLRTFARANMLDRYPGPAFPLTEARGLAQGVAQRLSPRPLLLMGQGVASAFRFPKEAGLLSWADYLLGQTIIRAAVVPHPSGRNLWYNEPGNRERAVAFIQRSCEELGCFQDIGG